MIKLFPLLLALTTAQPHPFEYDGALVDGSFGQKLDFCRRVNDIRDPGIVEKLAELLPHFEDNYPTILEVQKLVPTDNYLANLLDFIDQSELDEGKKQALYKAGYERTEGKGEWPQTLSIILNEQPELVSKEMLVRLLASEKTSLRMKAERILKTRSAKERGRGHADPTFLPESPSHRRPPLSVGNPLITLQPGVGWGITGSVVFLFSALGWWLWSRHRQRVE